MADFARKPQTRHVEPEFLPPDPATIRRPATRRMIDISDAEFEVVGARGPASAFNDNRPGKTGAARNILSHLAGRLGQTVQSGERGLSELSRQTFLTLTGFAALAVFTIVVGLGAAIGQAGTAPDASFPLAISQVSSHVEQANGLDLLVVTGRVENRGDQAQFVPVIRLSVGQPANPDRTADIAPPAGKLDPGQSAAFKVRINQSGGKPGQIHLSFVSPAGIDLSL